MPTGISQSLFTPAALAQRSMPQSGQAAQRPREAPPAAETTNPQTVLNSNRDALVRAADPKTSGQGAENQLASGAGSMPTSGARTPAGGAIPPGSATYGPGGRMAEGMGKAIDLIV